MVFAEHRLNGLSLAISDFAAELMSQPFEDTATVDDLLRGHRLRGGGSGLSQHGGSSVTAALTKHDPKARPVSRIEDFAAVKDKITLLAARELTLIDKGQWTVLQSDLDLRNQCGHPTKFKPGPKKASSLIEDLINNVF